MKFWEIALLNLSCYEKNLKNNDFFVFSLDKSNETKYNKSSQRMTNVHSTSKSDVTIYPAR